MLPCLDTHFKTIYCTLQFTKSNLTEIRVNIRHVQWCKEIVKEIISEALDPSLSIRPRKPSIPPPDMLVVDEWRQAVVWVLLNNISKVSQQARDTLVCLDSEDDDLDGNEFIEKRPKLWKFVSRKWMCEQVRFM